VSRNRILLVDDDAAIRFAVRSFLEAHEIGVMEAHSHQEALQQLAKSAPDAAILDLSLPDGDGFGLLQEIRNIDSDIPVIILTGQGTIETAVRAMSQGARNFLTKPVQLSALEAVLQRELQNRRFRQQSLAASSRTRREELDPFLGTSVAIRKLRQLSHRVAGSDSPLLIVGETGAGKGVLANWIHANSPRREETFLDLNCAGLSREFLETELFGHEKGAFTSAVSAKPGLLEVADRGTVFLDEIGDMDLQVQPKLLKVLETQQFRRLGDVRDRTVDVRLISATHRDLERSVRDGRFREDLYYRINIIQLRIPSLRSRPEDIPTLAEQFLQRMGRQRGRGEIGMDKSAIDALQQYSWPGNIRELHNVLERAVLVAEHNPLTVHDLHFQCTSEAAPRAVLPPSAVLTLKQMERSCIKAALEEENGSVEKAARRLGIPRSSLYNKARRLDIDLHDARNGH